MPIFTAAATALLSSTALAGSLIATNLVASVLAIGTGKLLGVFDAPNLSGAGAAVDEGVDLRLQPNPRNRLPLMYGDYQARGVEIYATASNEGQKVHYVLALGEITKMDSDTTDTTIDSFYWEDYELNVDTDPNSATFGGVTGARLDTDPANTFPETKFNGIIEVRAYPTGGPSAFLSGVAPTDEWTVENHRMTDVVYVVVSLTYNRDAGVVGLSQMRFRGTAPISNPAVAVRDILTNTRYGLALDDATYINSVTDLNNPRSRYSFATIADYFDETFQPFDDSPADNIRSRIDGLVTTNATVATRIETILRGGYGSLRWNNGLFSIFVNREDSATSFIFDDSNIVGSITVSEPGFNTFYTGSILTRAGTADNNFEDIIDEIDVSDLPFNSILNIRLPLTRSVSEAAHRSNNALRLGAEQFSIMHRASIDAFPVEVGDVVSYNNEDFGWNSKLFRIIKKTLSESTGGVFFDIEAIEYDDGQYTEADDLPVDFVPNTGNPGVQTLPPVDDLAVTGTFRTAATPYIAVSWTVPSEGFFEEFDVFYNNQTTNFNSNATVFGGSVRNTGVNSYTNGDTLTFDVVGVPAGDVSIWVRGRNDYTRSLESNRAFVNNWVPIVDPTGSFEEVFRYNETPSVIDGLNVDVGAPPANVTGIGTGRNNLAADTGWYEFDPEATDRENAPVWTAMTEAERGGAEPRELDFTFSGTSGDEIAVQTDVAQVTDFDISGTSGNRTLQYVARPQIDTFTFSGQAAEADSVDPGLEEVWRIDCTGNTEETVSPTMEQFFFHPQGTSSTFTAEEFVFTPDEGTTSTSSTSVSRTGLTFDSQGGAADEFNLVVDNALITSGTTLNNVNATTSSRIQIGNLGSSVDYQSIATLLGLDITSFNNAARSVTAGITVTLESSTSTITIVNIKQATMLGGGNQFVSFHAVTSTDSADSNLFDGTFTDGDGGYTLTLSNASGVLLTLDSQPRFYQLPNNLSGAASIGAALNTAIGTDFSGGFTKALDAATGVITFTADDADDHTGSLVTVNGNNGNFNIVTTNNEVGDAATTIQFVIATDSIDETITIPSNLTGTALFNNILTQLQATTAITDEFTVESAVVTIPGFIGATVVRLTANDLTNHTLATTISNGMAGTTSGSILDGQEATTATTIRIDYDADLTPIQQNITFGTNAAAVDVAAELASEIGMASTLTAVQGDTFTTTEGIVNSFGGVDNLTDNDRADGDPYTYDSDFEPVGDNDFGNLIASYTLTDGTSRSDFGTILTATDEVSSVGLIVGRKVGGIFPGIFGRFNVGDVIAVTDGGFTPDPDNIGFYRITAIESFPNGDPGLAPSSNEYLTVDVLFAIGTPFIIGGSTVYKILDENAFDRFEDISSTFVEDTTSASVLVKPSLKSNVSEPVITVVTQGTGSAAFAVSTQLQGRDSITGNAAFTSYNIILNGTSLINGTVGSASSSDEFTSSLRIDIDALANFSANSNGNVLTVTSASNTTDSLTAIIVQGVNENGKTSTNDLAVTKATTQIGSATDVFAGQDSIITVRIGTGIYYTGTYAGDSNADILTDLETNIDAVNTDFINRFSATVDGDTLTATAATFIGIAPTMTMAVTAGSTASSDAIGNITVVNSDLEIVRTEVNSGSERVVQSGQFSTFTVTQGTDEIVSAMDITGASSATSVAQQVRDAIAAVLNVQYNPSVSGPILSAISIFDGDSPDLNISVTPGLDTDDNATDLTVGKAINQIGDVGTIDLTDAVWTYAITAPTTDGDTTMIGDDGTIQVRRGLVLDTTELQETALSYDVGDVVSATTVTTGNKIATIVATGLVALPAISTTALSDVGYLIEYATGDDPIATDVEFLGQFYGSAANGQSSLYIDGAEVTTDTGSPYTMDDETMDYVSLNLNAEALSYVVEYLGLTSDADFQDTPATVIVRLRFDDTNGTTVTGATRVLYDGSSEIRIAGSSTNPATGTLAGSFAQANPMSVIIERADADTWVTLDTLTFNTAFPAIYTGQLVPVPLGVSATFDATADTKYTFRMTRTGNNIIGGFSWNMLMLEELRAT